MAGLFFCLASAEGAGLLFLPGGISATHKRLQRPFCRPCNLYRQRYKAAHKALQVRFRQFDPFHRIQYQTGKSRYNTACAALEHITAPQHLQRIPDTRYHAGRCTGQRSRPIIIRYIRAHRCPLLWIHARQCSISQTMPARRGQLLLCVDHWQVLHPAHLLRGQRLHLYRVGPAACSLAPVSSQAHRDSLTPSTRRGSPVAETRRAARNHWRLAPHLFSGFRPIANRGQQ